MKTNMTEMEKWQLKSRISLTAKMVKQVTAWFCRGEATTADVEKWEVKLSRECDQAAANGMVL